MKSLPLDKCPPYDPLSYAWGFGKKMAIQCNGVQLDIQPNLYHALEQYRSELKEIVPSSNTLTKKWIWADALCINKKL
jgi:hypothetical protein